MSTKATDRKLPMRVKLGYPLAACAPTIQTLVQMYFLVFFYTNILGISGAAAGTIILIARIWDFINDPLMGILVEKTRKPSGKCLFWMKRAVVPVGIFMVLCYSAPNLPNNMKVVWAFVSFICLGMSQTAYSIPKDSLMPKLTTDREERSKLNVYNQIYSNILNAVVPAVTMPLVAVLSGYGENTAFTKLAAIYACVYILMGFVGIMACKGYELEEEEEASGKPAMSAGEMLKALAQNKISLVVLLIQVVKMLFSSITGSVLIYFCTYNLGNVNIMSATTSAGQVMGMLAVLTLVPLYRKFGNAGTGILAAGIGLAPYLFQVIIHNNNPTIYVVCELIGGVGVTLVGAVLVQCLMDSLDYGEWKTGHKNTAVVMSAFGIGTKIGLAFGSSVAAYVVGFIQFDPNAATQPASVLNVFFNLTITGQVVVYAVMILLFAYLLRIEKKLPQMRAEIEERRAAKSQA